MYEISNSEIQTFQRCPRQWALTYHWQYQPKREYRSPVSVAQMGTRIHLAMEAHYGYDIDMVDAIKWIYATEPLAWPGYEDELYKEGTMAITMVEGYKEWIESEGIDIALETVDVERELKFEISTYMGPAVLRAKLDQLVQRKLDGALMLRDFKTVGDFSKANRLILDQQMRFYSMLLGLTHPDKRVDGALYMMLKRSKRTTRATPPFYRQDEVRYNRHDLNNTYLRVVSVVGKILEAHWRLDNTADDHHMVAYPNPSDYCNWGCSYFQVCPLMDDGSRWDMAIQNNYRVANPYEYYEHDMIEHLVKDLGGEYACPVAKEVNEETHE